MLTDARDCLCLTSISAPSEHQHRFEEGSIWGMIGPQSIPARC